MGPCLLPLIKGNPFLLPVRRTGYNGSGRNPMAFVVHSVLLSKAPVLRPARVQGTGRPLCRRRRSMLRALSRSRLWVVLGLGAPILLLPSLWAQAQPTVGRQQEADAVKQAETELQLKRE